MNEQDHNPYTKNRKLLICATPFVFIYGIILGICIGWCMAWDEMKKAWYENITLKELWNRIEPFN